jgi:hypothetical protein
MSEINWPLKKYWKFLWRSARRAWGTRDRGASNAEAAGVVILALL